MPFFWIVRTMHTIAVLLARTNSRDKGTPNKPFALCQRNSLFMLAITGLITRKQAKFYNLGMF